MRLRFKCTSGFTTLFVILIISAFIMGLIAIIPIIFEIQKQTNLYRHQLILSRNILACHDSYLRKAYGLSSYHEEVIEKLTLKQFEGTPYLNMAHQVNPVLTLNDTKALLDEMKVVTLLYTAESLSSEWVENFSGVYQWSNIRELFTKLQTIEMVEENETSIKESTQNAIEKSKEKPVMSEDAIDKLNQYKRLLKRCNASEKTLFSPINSGENYSIKDRTIINQYIMGSLNDRVISQAHELEFFSSDKRTLFNRGCEIEYIITGNQSSAKEEVEVSMFFIRFIINYLEGLASPTTMARIESQAATLIGIPIPIGVVILLSLESATRGDADMKKLLSGEGVPIPVLKNVKGQGNHKELKLYYDDHLRILLGLVSVEKIVQRFHQVVAFTYQQDNQRVYTPKTCIVSHEMISTHKDKIWSRIQDGYMVFSK